MAICESFSSYTDSQFFIDEMGEIPKAAQHSEDFDQIDHTYAVKVQALNIGWIFEKENEKQALRFFKSLVKHPNLDHFRIESIQILIEFLFNNLQPYYRKIVYPPFFAFSLALGYYIMLNEQYRSRLVKVHAADGAEKYQTDVI